MAAHRYWRLVTLSIWGTDYGAVAELAMAESAGGANVATTGNGTASASSIYSGGNRLAAHAFDGNTTTYWANYQGQQINAWLKFDFGAGVTRDIKEIKITTPVADGLQGQFIRAARFEWSDDDTIWSTADVLAEMGNLASTTFTHDVGPRIGSFALTGPSPTAMAYCGASANGLTCAIAGIQAFMSGGVGLTTPSPRLTFYAHDSYGEQAAHLTCPTPVLSIRTGANIKVRAPTPALSMAGTGTNWANVALTAPTPIVAASGTGAAMATATLTAPKPNLIGYGGAVCSITLTGRPTVQATGTTGGIASIAITAPLFELTASATAQNHGSINVLAPSPKLGGQARAWIIAPMARLTAIGSAVITATYEAYAVNLKHSPRGPEQPVDETTHYTNFPFTHVVRYQNSYFGANSTGLYLLEGTTDAGTEIPWAVKTAMDDFKTPTKKTIASAYFSGRFGPASTVQLHAGEQAPNTYSFSTPRDALAQNHRQVFGKGIKERYFALGASGAGTCEIDAIELEVNNMTRRI